MAQLDPLGIMDADLDSCVPTDIITSSDKLGEELTLRNRPPLRVFSAPPRWLEESLKRYRTAEETLLLYDNVLFLNRALFQDFILCLNRIVLPHLTSEDLRSVMKVRELTSNHFSVSHTET